MSLFPFIDGSTTTASSSFTDTPKEYAMDFSTGEFILENGCFVIVEGAEALKIWIYKALFTNRFQYLGYTWNYGSELMRLIGTGNSANKNVLESEAQRYVKEALNHPAIKGIRNFSATITDDIMTLDFVVFTDYGEVQIHV